MTQVSKIPIRKEIEKRIQEIFISSISKVHSSDEVYRFISDLFSPVEQLMLEKRIAIAFLLYKGYNHRTISKLLKVSLSTVNRVSYKLQYGDKGYLRVITKIMVGEKMGEFFQKIDDFIGDLLPPKGRSWSDYRREQWVNKLKRQKPF